MSKKLSHEEAEALLTDWHQESGGLLVKVTDWDRSGEELPDSRPLVAIYDYAYRGGHLVWYIPWGERLHFLDPAENEIMEEPKTLLLKGAPDELGAQYGMKIVPLPKGRNKYRALIDDWRREPGHKDAFVEVTNTLNALLADPPVAPKIEPAPIEKYECAWVHETANISRPVLVGLLVRKTAPGALVEFVANSPYHPLAMKIKDDLQSGTGTFEPEIVWQYYITEYDNGVTVRVSAPFHVNAISLKEAAQRAEQHYEVEK